MYHHGLEIREVLISHIKTQHDLEQLQASAKATDEVLALLGQPRMEFRNEMPKYIREHMDSNPQLYDFMSRHSLRSFPYPDVYPFVHESVSADGFPVIVFTYKYYQKCKIDPDALTYRLFQVYSKIWSSKHYFVVDCTGFNAEEVAVKKIIASFMKLMPDEAARNCLEFYYLNITEKYLNWWFTLFKAHNPFLFPFKTPHSFINSDTCLLYTSRCV